MYYINTRNLFKISDMYVCTIGDIRNESKWDKIIPGLNQVGKCQQTNNFGNSNVGDYVILNIQIQYSTPFFPK